jgi:hypothetical protein
MHRVENLIAACPEVALYDIEDPTPPTNFDESVGIAFTDHINELATVDDHHLPSARIVKAADGRPQ